MPTARSLLGTLGEDLAERALVARGWEILARNWRRRAGEIDLVALDGECYVFVEVKTRRGHRVEYPEDALTPRKSGRLASLAQAYLAERALGDVDWRIDLVAVELGPGNSLKRLEVISGVAADG
jgi:putative endonuclease